MGLTAAVLAKALTGFALLALFMHCGSYILLGLKALAARWRRGKYGRQNQPGVTLLLPLDGNASAPALKAALEAGFAEIYQPKEIIFCVYRQNEMSRAVIRAAREDNAAQASLLVSVPAGAESAAKARAAGLVKGFKAARYDYVAAAPPNAVLPADYIVRFLSAAARNAGKKKRETALICMPLWAVKARGLRARLASLFFNRGQIRLSLANCFGANAANAALDGAQAALWNYEALHKTGGADAFAGKAAAHGAAAAATEMIRAQGAAIHYAAAVLPLDFSAGGQGGKNGLAAAADLRFCRRFLPKGFYAELLLAPFLPFLACAGAWALGGLSAAALFGFIIFWYAAELLFCALWGAKAAGDKAVWKTYALLPVRDSLTPFLWLAAVLRC